ncbi:MAG: NAD-dependent epimerase/dehydratase family protein [Promethearchaeota archaeon]
MNVENALVTGANGFVGAYLCKNLVEHGINVYAMVRRTSNLSLLRELIPSDKFEDNSNIGSIKSGTLKIVYGDILDLESLRRNIKGMQYIFNIAGVVKGLRQEDFDRVNVWGALNIIKVILEDKNGESIKKVVFISSSAAAGPSAADKALTEEDEPHPIKGDFYGQSKWRMENEVLKYKDKIPLVIVRPPTVLGGGDSVSLDLFKMVKKGLKLVVGRKPKYYSIVDIRDLADALYKIILTDFESGEIFYIVSEESIEWGELQDIIAREVFNRNKKLRKIIVPPRIGLFLGSILSFFGRIFNKVPFLSKSKMLEAVAPSWINSSEKAERILDWKPKYSIEQIVKDAGQWYLEHNML